MNAKITVYLPVDVFARLERAKKAAGVSRATMMAELIEHALTELEAASTAKKEKPCSGTI